MLFLDGSRALQREKRWRNAGFDFVGFGARSLRVSKSTGALKQKPKGFGETRIRPPLAGLNDCENRELVDLSADFPQRHK